MIENREEFTKFMENMSCLSMMSLQYDDRCLLSKNLKHCDNFTNIINYFQLMYCVLNVRNSRSEIAVMFLYSLLYFLLMSIVFVCINQYYMQALKIAAIRFKMNEYLAGVILVGLANTTADFMLNVSLVRIDSPTMNNVMCGVLTAICLSGGAICFIMPFKMNGACVFRDFVIVLFLLQLIRFFMVSSVPGNWIKAAILFVIYPVYIAINIVDYLLTRYNIKKLRRQINVLRYEPSSPQLDKKLYDKVLTLADLEVEDDVQLLRMKTRFGIFRGGVYVTPKPLYEVRKEVDVERYRTALHSKSNPKNRFLFTEFFEEINPFDSEHWSLSGNLGRLKHICIAPVLFFLRLTIPRVDYELVKHGWSKLLNCLQIIIGPFVIVFLLETMHHSTHQDSCIIIFYYEVACWSLLVTVPLSIVVFHHSRTDIPPRFHKVFAIQTIITVITFVWVCCWEMEVIMLLIGIGCKLSAEYIGVTFTSFSNAVPDMIAYVHLSQSGYGKMAFGGIIGSAVFNLVSNIGAQFATDQRDYSYMFGNFGETIYLFLTLTICSTIAWCSLLDFNARRSGGIFLWCLYGLFFLYVTLMEMSVIHFFTDDMVIKDKY